MNSKELIKINEQFGAHNYKPLPVMLSEGKGVWVTDVDGNRYLDMLAGYSALNFGHQNDRLIKVAERQLQKLTLTSRAFFSEEHSLLCKELAEFCGLEVVLPMNTGTEAVETAIKAARKWGYEVKGIPDNQAEIIVFSNNFHGRSTTIVGFSTESKYREHFGPFAPGFKIVNYGDINAVEKEITPNTCAVLVEPIQGEGGVIIPPLGFIKALRSICDKQRLLLMADEIQTGLCRTGKIWAVEHEDVMPDIFIIGKALGGGILPASAVVGKKEVMDLFTPGTHGSTFGGNPLAAAIAREVIRLIKDEKPERRSAELGEYFFNAIRSIKSSKVEAVRGRGLMIGLDISNSYGSANKVAYELLKHGVLSKDTRSQTLRFAPALCITKQEIDWALERIEKVLVG